MHIKEYLNRSPTSNVSVPGFFPVHIPEKSLRILENLTNDFTRSSMKMRITWICSLLISLVKRGRIARTWREYLSGNVSRRNVYPISALLACVCLGIWFTGNSHLFYHLIPEEKGWLPEIDQKTETLQCKTLLQTARKILNGEEIPLPFNSKKTLWPFKERVSKEILLNNLNYDRENESSAEALQKYKHYNVSAKEIIARKIFITFGHNCCLYAKRRALQHARSVGGFDFVHSFNLHSLPIKFRETHANVLNTKRGAGYWLWKPYILLKTLIENMAEGDLVMYQDAGAYLIRSAAPLLKLCQESRHDIIIFNLDKTEEHYTKEDAFVLMNMDFAEARQSFQRLASFIIIKKSCSSIQFVMEWLAYLSHQYIASNDENKMGSPNADSFVAHRHDQSVLSLLSKKWGIPALRDPSQHGIQHIHRYYSSGPYQQLIVHDRFKN